MKKILSVLLVASSLFGAHYKYEVSPMIGLNIPEGNIDLDNYALFGVEAQFNDTLLPIFKPEFSLFYAKATYNEPSALDGKKSDIFRFAANGVYEGTAVFKERVVPFLKAGVGYENLDVYSSGNHNSVYVDAGGGAKLLLTKRWAFKAEALYLLKDNSTRLDSNFEMLVGLTYSFGETPEKKYLERIYEEHEESASVAASKQEASTKSMAAKKTVGDEDKDGVFDPNDECPRTPQSVKVGPNGCEIDSDGDGVVDSKDLCKKTPKVFKVDADGCPLPQKLLVHFKFNSYDIGAAAKEQIEKFARFFKAAPIYNVTLVGHADSIGSEEINLILSKKRAQSVKNALIGYGVNPTRLAIKGMGESQPVASNKTKEGRAKNRRVEAILSKIK